MSDPSRTATVPPTTGSRSPKDIERDIEATRNRLAGTIDEISDRVKPATIAGKAKDKAKSQVVDEDGKVRLDRLAGAAAAAVSAIGLGILRRKH